MQAAGVTALDQQVVGCSFVLTGRHFSLRSQGMGGCACSQKSITYKVRCCSSLADQYSQHTLLISSRSWRRSLQAN